MAFGKLVDMTMDDEEQLDYPTPIAMDKPRFPCGMILSLRKEDLAKLGLTADCDVGDFLDIRAFATVISVRKAEDDECVSLQIEKMSVESENEE